MFPKFFSVMAVCWMWCSPFATAAPTYNWLFSGFDDSGPPGERLRLAYSQDGIQWSIDADSYAAPAGNGVRDPSIMRLNGVYYIAYTAASFGQASYFQIASSTDLVHWTYLCNVNTAFAGNGYFTWAPEWFIDRDGTVYIFVSLQRSDYSWRLYWTKAIRLDLTAWTPVQPVGGDMPNRGAIDPQVVRDGGTYYLFYRNYGDGGNTNAIEMARGTSPTAFSLYKTGDWIGIGSPREGVSVVHLDGSRWRLYYINLSVYGNPDYYCDSADGLMTWSAPAASNITGHGTVLALTSSASTPFDAFLFDYGLSGVDAGVDFDHDGVSDLEEFLLGGNPAQPDVSILPAVSRTTSGATTTLKYIFRSVINPGTVTWTVETSTDLVHWTVAVSGVNGVTITTMPADSKYNLNVVTVPAAAGGKVFARLRTTLPASVGN